MADSNWSKFIRREYPKHKTTAQVAMLVHKSRETVQRWRIMGFVVPSEYVQIGNSIVWLYTEEDVKAAKAFAHNVRPGRKSKDDEPKAAS